jgi:hypothetical protein
VSEELRVKSEESRVKSEEWKAHLGLEQITTSPPIPDIG